MSEDDAEGPRTSVRRVTLQEVADGAGVSAGAASYALTGRPGVSDSTRERVRRVAEELGWAPNPAARALSASRANAIGFAMIGPKGVRSIDTYFVELVSGLEREASSRGLGLVLRVADSTQQLVSIYREWWAARTVDGVVVTDLVVGDARLDAIRELAIPAVAIGGDAGMPHVSTVSGDAFETTERILNYLWTLGHRRIARVAGPAGLLHTVARDVAFENALRARSGSPGPESVVHTDYSSAQGMAAARELLIQQDRPTALIFDNDVMAVASLLVADELGLAVPDDVSLITWDDSDLCTIVRPAITAVVQEPTVQARTAVQLLSRLLDGGEHEHIVLPSRDFAVRGSSAPLASP